MVRKVFSCMLILGLPGLLSLSGCGGEITLPGAAAIDGLSVINTQKTVDDHVVGWVTDKDCSTVRASRGETYCQDKPVPVPVVRKVSYCYKTLGSVSCYDRPIPQNAPQLYGTRVEDVPINRE